MRRKAYIFIIACLLGPSILLAIDPYQKMAKELAKKIDKNNKPKVAVLALPYHNGIENNGSAIVAERLITQLAQIKGIRLIERTLLRKLLEEHALSETGILDGNSTKEIGKILGVDIIVSGTLIDLGAEKTEVNARVLDAQTGAILAAARTQVPKTWSDSSVLVRRRSAVAISEEEEEKPVDNQAIKIGIPATGRSGYGAPRGK